MHGVSSTCGKARTGLVPVALALLLTGSTASLALPGARSRHEFACSRCHTWKESAPTGSVCEDCHEPRVTELGFHQDRTRSCTGCHSAHEPTQLVTENDRFTVDFGDEGLLGHCATCHGIRTALANLSEGHRSATIVYHSNDVPLSALSRSDACLLCHAGRLVTFSERVPETPVFHTEASHPFGVRVRRGALSAMEIRSRLDPRLPLFDGRIECQTCHSLHARTDDLLIAFESKYDLCLGCHQHGEDRKESGTGSALDSSRFTRRTTGGYQAVGAVVPGRP